MPSMSLLKAVPDQCLNEGAGFKPLDLKIFIKLADARTQLRFHAALKNGSPLPKGLICTPEGIVSGIPAKGTAENYVILVTAEDIEGETFSLEFNLLIKQINVADQRTIIQALKTQIWQAMQTGQPIPTMADLGDVFNWPITPFDVYYLLERFAFLTVWNAHNLDAPGPLNLLSLKGASPHYLVYDRGSCLTGAPKDLFTHARTIQDTYMTARAMADEVYQRGWSIEFSGFDKMVRMAWVRLQILGNQQGKFLEILNYSPPQADTIIYNKEIEALKPS